MILKPMTLSSICEQPLVVDLRTALFLPVTTEPSIIINKTLSADNSQLVVIIYTRNVINYISVNFLFVDTQILWC